MQQSSPLKSSLWTVQWHGKASVGLPGRLRWWTSSRSITTRLELTRRESEPNSKQEISSSEYNGQEAPQAFMHIPCSDLSRCQHDTMWHIQNVAKQWRPISSSSTFVASASIPHYHVEDGKHIYSFAHSFRAIEMPKGTHTSLTETPSKTLLANHALIAKLQLTKLLLANWFLVHLCKNDKVHSKRPKWGLTIP